MQNGLKANISNEHAQHAGHSCGHSCGCGGNCGANCACKRRERERRLALSLIERVAAHLEPARF